MAYFGHTFILIAVMRECWNLDFAAIVIQFSLNLQSSVHIYWVKQSYNEPWLVDVEDVLCNN